MTTQIDYTDEEWSQLLASPVYAGFYIIGADPNLAGLLKESQALFEAVEEHPHPPGASELLNSLTNDIEDRSKHQDPLPGVQTISQGSEQDPQAELLDKLQEIVAILDARTGADEATAFKTWLLSIAQSVAGASKEGGILGFGGISVSEKEQAALNQISKTLGL